MKTSYFQIICEEKLKAFWLAEDIKEFIPEVNYEFLDDNFEFMKVYSENYFYINEVMWVFGLNKIKAYDIRSPHITMSQFEAQKSFILSEKA